MSLISEALRKARQETAEREARQRGGTVPPRVIEGGGARFGAGLLLGAAIACFAGLVGAGAVWWILSRADAGDPHAAGSAPAVEQPAAESGVESSDSPMPAEEPAAASDGAGEAPATDASASEGGAHEPAAAGLAEPGEESGAGTAEEPEIQADGEQAQLPGGDEAAESEPSRTYLIDAQLGDVSLSLGYIVFRQNDPFAEINGVDLRVGGEIEGFIVEAIERDQVTLRDDQGLLVLRAH